MLKTREYRGKTTDDAIAKALAMLGLDRDDVSVEIVDRGRSGFLGIGATDAVVNVTYEAPDDEPAPEPAPAAEPTPSVAAPVKSADGADASPQEKKPAQAKKQQDKKPQQERKSQPEKKPQAEKKPQQEKKPQPEKKAQPEKSAPQGEAVPAKAARAAEGTQAEQTEAFLSGLLERMGVEADIAITPRKGGGLDVELSGSGIGAVIGRRGETLDAIQHLTNYAVNRGSDKRSHINVDAENYRAKREESLVHLAEKMAAKAVKYRRSMALEPMNSYERHVIHAALQDYEGVTTSYRDEESGHRI